MTKHNQSDNALPKRIAFYTRKVAEYGAVHPARLKPRSFTYRSERLMQYKELLHQHIDQYKKERAPKEQVI